MAEKEYWIGGTGKGLYEDTLEYVPAIDADAADGYPADSRTLRGFRTDQIILDEAPIADDEASRKIDLEFGNHRIAFSGTISLLNTAGVALFTAAKDYHISQVVLEVVTVLGITTVPEVSVGITTTTDQSIFLRRKLRGLSDGEYYSIGGEGVRKKVVNTNVVRLNTIVAGVGTTFNVVVHIYGMRTEV